MGSSSSQTPPSMGVLGVAHQDLIDEGAHVGGGSMVWLQ